MVVRSVYIVGFVDHNCLNFLFIPRMLIDINIMW